MTQFIDIAALADIPLQGARLVKTTRGCIVLERPDLLAKLVDSHHAKDSTARQTAMQELQAMAI